MGECAHSKCESTGFIDTFQSVHNKSINVFYAKRPHSFLVCETRDWFFSIPGNFEWLLEVKMVIFCLAEVYVPARFDELPTGTRESF